MGALKARPLKILITGSNGMLGQKLIELCIQKNIQFVATARGHNRVAACPDKNFYALDITSPSDVRHMIESKQPTHIINTAAMTNVDACEENKEECFAINRDGVDNIITSIKETDIHLVQISTDFIFDGEKSIYKETDSPNPLGIYGKSKWEAEKLLKNSNHKSITILRTSLLYGVGEGLQKSNIFTWAMTKLRQGETLNIVNDQMRSPTFVNDLAIACLKVIELDLKGIYHIAGGKIKSIYEYILVLAEYLKVDKNQIHPISTNELNQKAPRPKSSGLSIRKAQRDMEFKPTSFSESLKAIDVVV